MKLLERSYSTKIIRPKPTVHIEEDGSLLILATSWGQSEHSQTVIAEIVNYVNASKSDVEVTSPYEFLTCLSDEVNYVRTAILIANEMLYRGENRTDYSSGLEITVLLRDGNQIAWAHVGGPHIFIRRANQGLQPLSVSLDLASEHLDSRAPLPARMIGLDPTCHVQCGSTAMAENDQLMLLGCSQISESLWRNDVDFSLNDVSKALVQNRPDTPFWLGIISAEN